MFRKADGMFILIGGLGDSLYSLLPWITELNEQDCTKYLDLHIKGHTSFGHRVEVLRDKVLHAKEKVRLIGQSAGGLAALIVASELPEKVSGVIAVSPAMPRGISPIGGPLLPIMSRYALKMWRHKLIQVSTKEYTKLALNHVTRPDAILKHRIPISGREATELSTPWLQPKLEPAKVPTVIVYGTEDNWVSPKAHKKLANRLAQENPYTESISVPHGGHLPVHAHNGEQVVIQALNSLEWLERQYNGRART